MPPAGTTCPETASQPPHRVIPQLMRLNPVTKFAIGGDLGDGPALVGICIGMPTSEAEAIVRKHMHVKKEYVTDGSSLTHGSEGRLFANDDDSEFIMFFDGPPQLTGRVVMAAWGTYLPVGGDKQVFADTTKKYGTPTKFPGEAKPYWGDVETFPPCRGMTPDSPDNYSIYKCRLERWKKTIVVFRAVQSLLD